MLLHFEGILNLELKMQINASFVRGESESLNKMNSLFTFTHDKVYFGLLHLIHA